MNKIYQNRLDEIDIEVERLCSELLNKCDLLCNYLRSNTSLQILKLSRKVRNMTLNDFAKSYDGNINTVNNRKVDKMQKELHQWVQSTPRINKKKKKNLQSPPHHHIHNNKMYKNKNIVNIIEKY